MLPPVLQFLNLIKQEKKWNKKLQQQQQLCALQNAIEFRSRVKFEFHFSKASTAELEKKPFYWLKHLIFLSILKTTKPLQNAFCFVLLFIPQRRRRVNEVKERGQRTFSSDVLWKCTLNTLRKKKKREEKHFDAQKLAEK